MKINILQLVDGAKQAKGITVIIDVFRACTVEAYVMNGGAKTVIPVADKDIAYALKKQNPSYVLVGERNGVKLPDFDFGNSPSQMENFDFHNKTVIHTTSAGTQGIGNAVNASEILTGALVNAKATANYILSQNPEEVSLVCMGLNALRPIEEDTLCAEYIKSILSGKERDIKNDIESLRYTSGAKFFDARQRDVFPEKDFYLATTLNKFGFVLKVADGDNGLKKVVKL